MDDKTRICWKTWAKATRRSHRYTGPTGLIVGFTITAPGRTAEKNPSKDPRHWLTASEERAGPPKGSHASMECRIHRGQVGP